MWVTFATDSRTAVYQSPLVRGWERCFMMMSWHLECLRHNRVRKLQPNKPSFLTKSVDISAG